MRKKEKFRGKILINRKKLIWKKGMTSEMQL